MDWVGRNLCEFLYYQLLGTTRISSLEFGGLGRSGTYFEKVLDLQRFFLLIGYQNMVQCFGAPSMRRFFSHYKPYAK